MPTNISARPTTDFARENIFNVIENLTDLEGCDALDLFAGTGAISFEFLSRECRSVTAVEKAATQYRFIKDVAQRLGDDNLHLVRGDGCKSLILGSDMLKDGTLVIIEHSKAYDFSSLPYFKEHRAYGSVNFSIFRINIDK